MSENSTHTEFKEMEKANLRLQGLLGSFYLLNSSLDLDTVLQNTLKKATELMAAEIGSIALINEKDINLVFVASTDPNFAKLKNFTVPLGKGIAGNVAATGKSLRVHDVHHDQRWYQKIDEELAHRTESILCVPLITNDKIIGTAQIMNRLDGQAFTEEDEKLMEGFSRQAALAIQNARMHQILLKQKAIESELQVCGEIQRKLFPEKLPDIPGIEIFGDTVPTREVGGDYYTFIARFDGSYDAVVADVSGKGLSASMMVSELHTGIHLISRMDYGLRESIDQINGHLNDSLLPGKFITIFIARFRPESYEFEYVLGGHPPPLIVERTGGLRYLERTGMVLGLTKEKFTSLQNTLAPGELLVSYSDGYSEAQNPEVDLFGEENIARTVKEFADRPLKEIRERLDERIREFTRGHPASDDATLLLMRRKL